MKNTRNRQKWQLHAVADARALFCNDLFGGARNTGSGSRGRSQSCIYMVPSIQSNLSVGISLALQTRLEFTFVRMAMTVAYCCSAQWHGIWKPMFGFVKIAKCFVSHHNRTNQSLRDTNIDSRTSHTIFRIYSQNRTRNCIFSVFFGNRFSSIEFHRTIAASSVWESFIVFFLWSFFNAWGVSANHHHRYQWNGRTFRLYRNVRPLFSRWIHFRLFEPIRTTHSDGFDSVNRTFDRITTSNPKQQLLLSSLCVSACWCRPYGRPERHLRTAYAQHTDSRSY